MRSRRSSIRPFPPGAPDHFPSEYAPKHGSWLNVAEIELSALCGQCLNRRMPDRATVSEQMLAWEQDRNNRDATVDWQFATRDARIKLESLYPKISRVRCTRRVSCFRDERAANHERLAQ